MKNSEIHTGLDKKEIRDFLAIEFLKLFNEEFENKKETIPYNKEDVFDWCVKDGEAQIKVLKKYVEISKSRQAIIQLIKMNGWQEFDVSDDTEKDLPYKLKMSFIGTPEEHEKFLMLNNGV